MIFTGIAALIGLVALINLFRVRGVTREMISGRVSILIPARNEEFTLPACLLSASFTSAREILVYDDASEDGTANVVYSTMLRYDRIKLIEGGPLPAGWVGKAHACQKLADAASGEWLLFLDARARLSSRAVERLVAEADRRKLTWLTCWPETELETIAQKMLLPALNFAVFGFRPGMLAQSGCILVHKATYELLGGHGSFSGEIGADAALAREWRRRGERAACFDGRGIVTRSARADLVQLWATFRRHFYLAFPGKAAFAGWFLALSVASFTPWWEPALVIVLVRLAYAVRFRQPIWSALLHPVAMTFLLAAALASYLEARSREGVEWRGRRYLVK